MSLSLLKLFLVFIQVSNMSVILSKSNSVFFVQLAYLLLIGYVHGVPFFCSLHLSLHLCSRIKYFVFTLCLPVM